MPVAPPRPWESWAQPCTWWVISSTGFDNIQLGTVTTPRIRSCFLQGMIMKPSSSADFQKDPKVQSHPDPIQIHLEPRVIQWDFPHLQRTATACTPSAQQSQSAHHVVFTCFPAVWLRFRTHHAAAVLEISAYYAGPWFGTPGGSRGSWWCVATRQVRRRRSWKRGRPGSSPVPEVPSQVMRSWAMGPVQVMEVPWKFQGFGSWINPQNSWWYGKLT